MTSRFYTEQRLNRDLEVYDFQTGSLRYPLDIEHLGSLPSALGATTLPPQGAFSTETDVSNLSKIASGDAEICTQFPCPKRMYNPFRNPTGHGDAAFGYGPTRMHDPFRNPTGHGDAQFMQPLVKPIHVALAGVALYLLFLPMGV